MNEQMISLRLAKLREAKGVSARDMSLSLGQNPGYIYNIEAGKSNPSLTGLFYICDYFGISPGEFFEEENTDPVKLQGIIQDLKRLNDHQLDTVSRLVKDILDK